MRFNVNSDDHKPMIYFPRPENYIMWCISFYRKRTGTGDQAIMCTFQGLHGDGKDAETKAQFSLEGRGARFTASFFRALRLEDIQNATDDRSLSSAIGLKPFIGSMKPSERNARYLEVRGYHVPNPRDAAIIASLDLQIGVDDGHSIAVPAPPKAEAEGQAPPETQWGDGGYPEF